MTMETACDRLERQWHEDQWWRAYFLARRSYRLALEAQPAQCAAIISPLRRGRGDGLVDAAAAFEMVDMAGDVGRRTAVLGRHTRSRMRPPACGDLRSVDARYSGAGKHPRDHGGATM